MQGEVEVGHGVDGRQGMTAEESGFGDHGKRECVDELIDRISNPSPFRPEHHSKTVIEEFHIVAATLAHSTPGSLGEFVIAENNVDLTRERQYLLGHLAEHSIGQIATMREIWTVDQFLQKNVAIRARFEICQSSDLVEMDEMIVEISTDDQMSLGWKTDNRSLPLGIGQDRSRRLLEQTDGLIRILEIDAHERSFDFPRFEWMAELPPVVPLRTIPMDVIRSQALLALVSENSTPMFRRSKALATVEVVPLPRKGSSTRSPGFDVARMTRSR